MVTTGNLFAALDEIVTKAVTARDEFENADDLEQLNKDLNGVADFIYEVSNRVFAAKEALSELGKLAG